MIRFHGKVFEDYVTKGTTTYTSVKHLSALSLGDQIGIFAFVDQCNFGGTLTVAIQHSRDGINFSQKNATPEINAVTINAGTTNNTAYGGEAFPNAPTGEYVRFAVSVNAVGSTPTMRITIHAVVRDRGTDLCGQHEPGTHSVSPDGTDTRDSVGSSCSCVASEIGLPQKSGGGCGCSGGTASATTGVKPSKHHKGKGPLRKRPLEQVAQDPGLGISAYPQPVRVEIVNELCNGASAAPSPLRPPKTVTVPARVKPGDPVYAPIDLVSKAGRSSGGGGGFRGGGSPGPGGFRANRGVIAQLRQVLGAMTRLQRAQLAKIGQQLQQQLAKGPRLGGFGQGKVQTFLGRVDATGRGFHWGNIATGGDFGLGEGSSNSSGSLEGWAPTKFPGEGSGDTGLFGGPSPDEGGAPPPDDQGETWAFPPQPPPGDANNMSLGNQPNASFEGDRPNASFEGDGTPQRVLEHLDGSEDGGDPGDGTPIGWDANGNLLASGDKVQTKVPLNQQTGGTAEGPQTTHNMAGDGIVTEPSPVMQPSDTGSRAPVPDPAPPPNQTPTNQAPQPSSTSSDDPRQEADFQNPLAGSDEQNALDYLKGGARAWQVNTPPPIPPTTVVPLPSSSTEQSGPGAVFQGSAAQDRGSYGTPTGSFGGSETPEGQSWFGARPKRGSSGSSSGLSPLNGTTAGPGASVGEVSGPLSRAQDFGRGVGDQILGDYLSAPVVVGIETNPLLLAACGFIGRQRWTRATRMDRVSLAWHLANVARNSRRCG